MHSDRHFINVKTGEVIEVTGTDAELSKITTLTATGRAVRPRTVKTTSLKPSHLNARGIPYKAAFVAVTALPPGHPMAFDAELAQAPTLSTVRVDLRAMSDLELSVYGRQKKAERELAASLEEEVKSELKRRNPHARTYVYGDTALAISTNIRFDGKIAKQVLTPKEYAAILKPKPDSALAKEVLGEKRYAQVCKDHGNKIEIRFATQTDRETVAEAEEIEALKSEIAGQAMGASESPFPDSVAAFYPAEPVTAPF